MDFGTAHIKLSSGVVTGMSGGPIMNEEFKVIGISVKGGVDITFESSSLVLPISTLKSFLFET